MQLVLSRKPDIPDSLLSFYVDSTGNLTAKFAKFYSEQKGISEIFSNRDFYFDYRNTLCSGSLDLGDNVIKIGLFDYSNNGCFTDPDDVLIIDLNKNGILEYFGGLEVFDLNDVFSISNKNYKISYIDKYGQSLIIKQTSEEPTFRFLQKQKSEENNNFQKLEIDSLLWTSRFKCLDDSKFNFADYKGKPILLNFWGEWCSGCIAEIPELIECYNQLKDSVVFVSFLKTYNKKLAQKLITKYNIQWKQIELTSQIERMFLVKGFPTNILIYPNGKTCIKKGSINSNFIKDNLNRY